MRKGFGLATKVQAAPTAADRELPPFPKRQMLILGESDQG